MDLYATLGVDRGATQDEIASAHRKLAREHHPDMGGDAEKFKAVAFAYEILGDPDKRAKYDATGSTTSGPSIAESTIADLVAQAVLNEANVGQFLDRKCLVKWICETVDTQRDQHKRAKLRSEDTLKKVRKLHDQFLAANETTDNPTSRDFIAACMQGKIDVLQQTIAAEAQAIDDGTEILAFMNGIKSPVAREASRWHPGQFNSQFASLADLRYAGLSTE